jgi:hypothetical protein
MRLALLIAAVCFLTGVDTFQKIVGICERKSWIRRGADHLCLSRFHAILKIAEAKRFHTIKSSATGAQTEDLPEEYELVQAGDNGWTIRALTYGDEVYNICA